MANLVDDSGSVNSNLVSGRGTNAATFPMPGNVALQVESVVATVDNSGGGATGATLVVKDQSGVVIATKRQDDVIPAGDTGTATFALRLADSTRGFIRYHIVNDGDYLLVQADGNYLGSFNVGGHTSAWSIGLNGGIVGVGADTHLVLSSPGVTDVEGLAGVNVSSDSSIVIEGDDSTYNVSDFFQMQTGSGGYTLTCNGDFFVDTSSGSGDAFVVLRSGGMLEVRDSLNHPIFRVNEDGSLQGKTGKALTFNL